MDSETAFAQFGHAIETDALDIVLAKWRRDQLVQALLKRQEVDAVIETGSLARETTVGQIKDIDLVVIMKPGCEPGPSPDSGSAGTALTTFAGMLESTGLMGRVEPRNHVVKCDMDVLMDYIPFFSEAPLRGAPPVDVMPAFRAGVDPLHLLDTSLRVPEKRNDQWVTVNPEKLMRLVEDRQREWQYFKPVIRMIKAWAKKNRLDLPSALVEAIVLKYMPRPQFFQNLTYADALAGFFENAAQAHFNWFESWLLPVAINSQLNMLDYADLRDAFRDGAQLSQLAQQASRGEAEHAPDYYWHEIFGSAFPQSGWFEWIFTSPACAAQAKTPSEPWLDWLGRFFDRLRRQPDHEPMHDRTVARRWLAAPLDPPFPPPDEGLGHTSEPTVWESGRAFDDPAPSGPDRYGQPDHAWCG